MSYSTGSSAVRILVVMSLSSFNAAYKVVVFPLPVGPVTITIPFGLLMRPLTFSRSSSRKPTLSKLNCTLPRSNTRITTLSPNMVGNTATRRSTGALFKFNSMRPSCGRRRSAMSSFAMTFTRLTKAIAKLGGGGVISYSTPSMR